MATPRWLLWTGDRSTILHAAQGLNRATTACGIKAQMTGPYGISLPPGRYTHCDRCRALVDD